LLLLLKEVKDLEVLLTLLLFLSNPFLLISFLNFNFKLSKNSLSLFCKSLFLSILVLISTSLFCHSCETLLNIFSNAFFLIAVIHVSSTFHQANHNIAHIAGQAIGIADNALAQAKAHHTQVYFSKIHLLLSDFKIVGILSIA